MKGSLLFIFLFIFQAVFSQQKIYVSNSGNDYNVGTEKSPVYSLQAAFDLVKEKNPQSVEIKVGSGNYFFKKPLIINENYSRKTTSKIKVVGEKDNIPVFYGGNRMIPILDKQGNWIINVNEDKSRGLDVLPQILSINGQLRKISKFPSSTLLKTSKIKYLNGSFNVQIPSELNEILKSYNDENIKNISATFYVKWTAIIRYIDKHNYKESTITFKGDNLPDLYLIEPDKTQFRINNVEKRLNDGEWFYKNSNTIVYKPLETDHIDSSIVVLSKEKEIMTIAGTKNKKVSYVGFENISFNTVGNGLNKNGYFPYQAAANVESVIKISNANNINFNNILLSNISTNGFWIKEGCDHIKISNSDFSNLGAGAIKIGTPNYTSDGEVTNNIIVDNNKIKNGGQFYPDAVPLLIFNAHNNTISHNDISDFEYTGISVGWVWGYGKSQAYKNTISYNHIYNIGTGLLDDMGGIYTLGISDGTLIENNVIHNVTANNYGGWGIYLDEGSSNITIKNNLVYNCSASGFHQHYGKENNVENNIFAFNRDIELEASRIENHLSFTFKNNIIVHHNKKFFNQIWSVLKKNAFDNIYYSSESDQQYKSSDFSQNESTFHFINPFLQKKEFYYVIKNDEIFKVSNFKKIDFSRVGVYK